jgi:hypothetical protein
VWVKWSEVCKPKKLGGLGVKDLILFNVALLAKWRWRLLVENSLKWKNILCAKYGGTIGVSLDIPTTSIPNSLCLHCFCSSRSVFDEIIFVSVCSVSGEVVCVQYMGIGTAELPDCFWLRWWFRHGGDSEGL